MKAIFRFRFLLRDKIRQKMRTLQFFSLQPDLSAEKSCDRGGNGIKKMPMHLAKRKISLIYPSIHLSICLLYSF